MSKDTATQSLTSWLLDQIAADEAVARDMQHQARFGRPLLTLNGGGTGLRILVDPAHVLAVCAAHRSIVEAHPHRDCSEYERTWGSHAFGCATCHEFDGIVTASGYCPTLRALATAYADRPGWQEAWR